MPPCREGGRGEGGVHTMKVLWPSGLGNYFVCKQFAVQTVLWPLEFVVQNKSRATTPTQFETWFEVEVSQY